MCLAEPCLASSIHIYNPHSDMVVSHENMTQKNTQSRAFFLAVVLMTLLVVGTIVAYFLILPRALPKQIIVAVLPFDGPSSLSKHLTHAFPRHLNELVALSRELTVVDFDASWEAIDLKEKFRGFTEELGATHIVDGDFVEDEQNPGSYVLTIRVVNVTQVAWKLRWDEEYRYPDTSLLDIRNSAAAGILKGLYDNSVGEIAHEKSMEKGFESFLLAQSLVDLGDRQGAIEKLRELPDLDSNPYALFLLSTLDASQADELRELAIEANPRHYPSLIEQAWATYWKEGNLQQYIESITELAGTFPNSTAVERLAHLYHALGWFREEEELLFRWVRMRPRSGDAALLMAFSRYRQGNTPLVEEAIVIAKLRDEDNDRVDLYRALYDLEVRYNPNAHVDSPKFEVRDFAVAGRTEEARAVLQRIRDQLSCDDLVELALYLGDLDLAFDNLYCVFGFWVQPLGWWTTNDTRWESFTNDERYSSWLQSRGMVPSVISQLEPESVADLFAPVRRVIPSKTDRLQSPN